MAKKSKKEIQKEKISATEHLKSVLEKVIEYNGGVFGSTKESSNDSPPENLSFIKVLSELGGDVVHGNKCKEIGFEKVHKITQNDLSFGDIILVKTNVADVTAETSRACVFYVGETSTGITEGSIKQFKVLMFCKNPISEEVSIVETVVNFGRADGFFNFSSLWDGIEKNLKPPKIEVKKKPKKKEEDLDNL